MWGERRVHGTVALLVLVALSGSFTACSDARGPDGSGGAAMSGGAPGSGAGSSESGGAQAAGGAGAGGQTGSTSGSGGAIPVDAPTWAADIAPLIYRECVGCHREGGVGPFPLETYEQAAESALFLPVHLEMRHMPPMPVDGSGACNTYSNARWLTDAEIDVFTDWANAGAPLGDASLAPALPAPPPALDSPDLTLDPGAQYTPSDALADDYRCFVIDPGLTQEQFIVAYEVIPGDARIVHHAIVYQPSSDAAAAAAVALDAAEEGLGYTCFGGAGVDAEPRVLWAPGGGYVELPAETGVPLAPARPQILQVHYNLAAGAHPDRTTVKLALAPSVQRPATYQPIADLDMVLEPGQSAVSTTRSFPVFGQAFAVYGVMPHMHTLGRELSVTADADGDEHCLVSVDRWDFHSQGAWWYTQPLVFDAVDSVSISCTFDTSKRTEPVTWGEGTTDEMCLTYLYVTAP